MEGERETREEVKCNRGFIVCGSVGRERRERGGNGSSTRGGDKEEAESGNSALALTCSVSLQTGAFPIKQAGL